MNYNYCKTVCNFLSQQKFYCSKINSLAKKVVGNRKRKYTNVSDLYLVARTADNGGEDGARSVISGEAGLAHAGAVVDNQSRNIIVTHGDELNQRAALTENCKKEEENKGY